MPLYIKDDETARLVAELASQRHISKQAAARLAVQAELDRTAEAVPLTERLEKLWRDNPLPPPTGEVADKAFFDELSGPSLTNCRAICDDLCRRFGPCRNRRPWLLFKGEDFARTGIRSGPV